MSDHGYRGHHGLEHMVEAAILFLTIGIAIWVIQHIALGLATAWIWITNRKPSASP